MSAAGSAIVQDGRRLLRAMVPFLHAHAAEVEEKKCEEQESPGGDGAVPASKVSSRKSRSVLQRIAGDLRDLRGALEDSGFS